MILSVQLRSRSNLLTFLTVFHSSWAVDSCQPDQVAFSIHQSSGPSRKRDSELMPRVHLSCGQKSQTAISARNLPAVKGSNFRLHSSGFYSALFISDLLWMSPESVWKLTDVWCTSTYLFLKNNHPQDVFLTCVYTEEISRPGVPQSFTLAALVSEVAHCTVSSASDLVGARLPALSSYLQVGLIQVISKWGDAQREWQNQDPNFIYSLCHPINLWPIVC